MESGSYNYPGLYVPPPTDVLLVSGFVVPVVPRAAQALVLRGVAQGLAVNLNSVASTGNLWDIYCEWSEE